MRSLVHKLSWVFMLLLANGITGVTAHAQPTDLPTSETQVTDLPSAGAGKQVFVIPVTGEIGPASHLILLRALREAEKNHADAIVLDMDTLGGRVDASMDMRDALIETEVPTYTYVNNKAISAGSFLALSTDKIIMGPASSIGGALPITQGAEGARGADRKFISVFRAEMVKTAKTKGHDPDIARGFCDPEFEIPGLKETGDILTLDYDQATSIGFSPYQAATLNEMLVREGLGAAATTFFRETQFDRFARFISSAAVMSLLMLIGMGGIFMEIKTPGFGVPGTVGLLALILFFFGSHTANLSGYMEWVFFAAGLILIVLEVFVIPGFGLAGITGIIMVMGALFFSLFNLWPEDGFEVTPLRMDMMAGAAWQMVITIIAAVPIIYFLARLLPSTPLWSRMTLAPYVESQRATPSIQTAEGTTGKSVASSDEDDTLAVGTAGTALTDLRPTGTGKIDGRRMDVLTYGEYIERGSEIEVVHQEGNRIFVRKRP